MSANLLGEKAALEQTRLIVKQVPAKSMPKKMYKKIVLQIYHNQLKKYTSLNRAERHKRLKELLKAKNDK